MKNIKIKDKDVMIEIPKESYRDREAEKYIVMDDKY
jgi:hypothetical protein